MLSKLGYALLAIVTAQPALRQRPRDSARAQDTTLVGLWQSKRWFGPEVRGELRITHSGDRWQATIGSRTAEVHVAHDSASFDLPSAAKFRGHIIRNGAAIMGHWIEPARRTASPIVLASCGSGCYSGVVQPYNDEFT
ncbi:MAG: hypothetical protein ABI875_07300, partial [Gemmatimonadales bacterium]